MCIRRNSIKSSTKITCTLQYFKCTIESMNVYEHKACIKCHKGTLQYKHNGCNATPSVLVRPYDKYNKSVYNIFVNKKCSHGKMGTLTNEHKKNLHVKLRIQK